MQRCDGFWKTRNGDMECFIRRNPLLVSGSFLQQYWPHQLHTWYTWSPRWETEPYCISSCSSDFPPNAGLWFFDWFLEVFSKTISPIDFQLGIHDPPHAGYRRLLHIVALRRFPTECWPLIQGSPLGKIFISQLATENLFLVARANFWSPVGYWNFFFWSPVLFFLVARNIL